MCCPICPLQRLLKCYEAVLSAAEIWNMQEVPLVQICSTHDNYESLKGGFALMFNCGSLMALPAHFPQVRRASSHPDVAVTWHDLILSCACNQQIGASTQFGSHSLMQR